MIKFATMILFQHYRLYQGFARVEAPRTRYVVEVQLDEPSQLLPLTEFKKLRPEDHPVDDAPIPSREEGLNRARAASALQKKEVRL